MKDHSRLEQTGWLHIIYVDGKKVYEGNEKPDQDVVERKYHAKFLASMELRKFPHTIYKFFTPDYTPNEEQGYGHGV